MTSWMPPALADDFALDPDELAGCEWCGATHWVNCVCDPDGAEFARHVARLLRSGVSIADAFEAEELGGAA